MWGLFSWRIKEKRPPPHKDLGLSNLYAGDPFNSLCGYSLCVFSAVVVWGGCLGTRMTFPQVRGKLKYHPFWGSPLFHKAPPEQFQPPKCKSAPSKMYIATSNLQFLYRSTQKSPKANLCFGGRQFAFWRLKLSWGCFKEKGGPPKRGSFSLCACFPPSESPSRVKFA